MTKSPKEDMAAMPQPVVKGVATHNKYAGIERVAARSCDSVGELQHFPLSAQMTTNLTISKEMSLLMNGMLPALTFLSSKGLRFFSCIYVL